MVSPKQERIAKIVLDAAFEVHYAPCNTLSELFRLVLL
jgi:hypothetical protein